MVLRNLKRAFPIPVIFIAAVAVGCASESVVVERTVEVGGNIEVVVREVVVTATPVPSVYATEPPPTSAGAGHRPENVRWGGLTASDWAVLSVLAAPAFYFCSGLGGGIVDLYFRVVLRKHRMTLLRWGLEKRLYRISSHWFFSLWMIVMAGFSLVFSYAFLIAVGFYFSGIQGIAVREDSFTFSTFTLVSVFMVGFVVRGDRVSRLLQKAFTLERLPPYFRFRLGASEVATLYDGLAHAPEMAWEEFAGLSSAQIFGDAGRKYRELADLYISMDSLAWVKRGVVLGGVAVFIALAALLAELRGDLPFEIPFFPG